MPISPDLAITDQYQPKFENEWRRIAQQANSRLGSAVTVNTGCTGEVVYRDQIKPIDVIDLGTPGDPTSGRFQTIAVSEIDTQKRANYPNKYYVPKHFDRMDAAFLKDQSLPTSQTFTEMKSGFDRKQDDLIIAAATGGARTGDNGGTTTDLADYNGGKQIVDIQEDGTGSPTTDQGMNLAKLLKAKQILESNDVFGQDADGDAMGYIAMTSNQLFDLYQTTELTNADYAAELKALYRGEIDQFLGFKFIRSERLLLATTTRTCFAWVKSGIVLDIWENATFEIDKRTDLTHPWQLVGYGAMGATRLEEAKVVEIPCSEAGA